MKTVGRAILTLDAPNVQYNVKKKKLVLTIITDVNVYQTFEADSLKHFYTKVVEQLY